MGGGGARPGRTEKILVFGVKIRLEIIQLIRLYSSISSLYGVNNIRGHGNNTQREENAQTGRNGVQKRIFRDLKNSTFFSQKFNNFDKNFQPILIYL